MLSQLNGNPARLDFWLEAPRSADAFRSSESSESSELFSRLPSDPRPRRWRSATERSASRRRGCSRGWRLETSWQALRAARGAHGSSFFFFLFFLCVLFGVPFNKGTPVLGLSFFPLWGGNFGHHGLNEITCFCGFPGQKGQFGPKSFLFGFPSQELPLEEGRPWIFGTKEP